MAFTLTVTPTDDGTLMRAEHDVEVDWSDQTGWFDPDKVVDPLTIIGCGGIGSNVAFELITMGFRRFVLYDDDKVEPRNLASQKAYRHDDLYKLKAEERATAEATLLKDYDSDLPLLLDRLGQAVSARTSDDIATTDGRATLKTELLAGFREVLGPDEVLAVYFTDFVMQ